MNWEKTNISTIFIFANFPEQTDYYYLIKFYCKRANNFCIQFCWTDKAYSFFYKFLFQVWSHHNKDFGTHKFDSKTNMGNKPLIVTILIII